MWSRSPLFALLLAACASQAGPDPAPDPHSAGEINDGGAIYRVEASSRRPVVVHPVAAPREQVWKALPQVYSQLGLTANYVDEAAFAFGQRQVAVRRRLAGAPLSQYLECGSAVQGVPNANTYNVLLSVVTRLSARPDGSSGMEVQVDASARPVGRSDPPVRCGSTGVLERRIVSLAGGRPAS